MICEVRERDQKGSFYLYVEPESDTEAAALHMCHKDDPDTGPWLDRVVVLSAQKDEVIDMYSKVIKGGE